MLHMMGREAKRVTEAAPTTINFISGRFIKPEHVFESLSIILHMKKTQASSLRMLLLTMSVSLSLRGTVLVTSVFTKGGKHLHYSAQSCSVPLLGCSGSSVASMRQYPYAWVTEGTLANRTHPMESQSLRTTVNTTDAKPGTISLLCNRKFTGQ